MPPTKKKNKGHKLRKFDPSKVKSSAVCFFVGRRGSGKTTLVADIASRKEGRIPYGIAISCTEDANSFWGKHIPPAFVHSEFDDRLSQQLLRMQKETAEERGLDNLPPCFALYDDTMFDPAFAKSKTTREMFMNGRHFKIFLLITAQYCMDLPPALRTNIDYVFILKDPIKRNRQRLYENFAGIFPTFDGFCDAMDATTENYECMVIDNTSNSNKIEDAVFYYKADPAKSDTFKLGCKEFWELEAEPPPFCSTPPVDDTQSPRSILPSK